MPRIPPRFTALCLLLVTTVFLFPAAIPQARAQGTEADVLIAQAILAYEDRRYPEALDLLHEALQIDPANVEALYYMGLVQMATRNYPQAVEFLEKARDRAPADPAIKFQLGVAYFSLEQYDKAEPLLTDVFKLQPEKESLGYYVGFMRYRRKDYQGAVEAFKASRSSNPNIQQLSRFYSGLALGVLGLTEQAAGEFEEANRIRTVSPLTGPADRLRDSMIAAKDQRGRFHGELRFGLLYDTNVRTTPLAAVDPVVDSLRVNKTNSPGELASARLEYAIFRKGSFDAVATYSFFQTIYNDITAFNTQNNFGQLATYYSGLVKQLPYQLSAQYSYDRTTLGGDFFLGRHSATLIGTLIESERHLSILQGRVQVKDFSDLFLVGGGTNPAEDRSGTNYMLGFTHVVRFQQDKHLLRMGYQIDQDDTKGADWFYRGNRFLVGAQYTLPWRNIRANFDFDLHLRRYPHPNAIFPSTNPGTVKQNVTEQNYAVRLTYQLPYNFNLTLDNLTTISRSNLPQIFEYNRNVTTLGLSWVW
jgi:Flp pilus assembly protein TadD